jgi:hypothetical protein
LANYGVNINFKVIGQSKLDRALKKTEQLDKKVDLLNKRGIKGISSAVKILNQELAIKNKILKADQAILSVRTKQIKTNKANAATQALSARGGARGGAGGAGGGGLGGAALNSAIISGVFPLLFGQGPFAALGGATGGFLGGKFGGQMGGFAGGLAGTAIATGIQSGVTAIGELGQAMNILNPDITKLTEKMGILGTTEQKRLQIIEQTEGKQAALNAALEMMGDKIGDQNVQELKEFGETFQELTNSTVLFFTRVQGAVAKLLNQSLGGIQETFVTPGRIREFTEQNPNAPAFRNINQQIADLEAQKSGAGRQDVKRITDQINALKAQKNEIAETILLEKDKDEIRKNTNKLITAGLGDLKKENELNKAIIAGKEEEFLLNQAVEEKVKSMGLEMGKLNILQLERIRNDITINQGLKDQADAAQELAEKFDKIGESVEKSIVGNLTDAVMGTQSLGQAAVNVLNNVKRKLIEVQIERAVSGIGEGIGGFLGNLFKRERGGPVAAGGAYLVGEKGPEILQMGSKGGNIIPNSQIGGGGGVTNVVTVNVDASGSSVEGNDGQANEFGNILASAIQAELINQKRAGGLLSNA